MFWKIWRAHFEHNEHRPLPAIDRGGEEIPAMVRPPLARILARFQLGEAGEGRVAREIDRAVLPGIDDDYRRSLKLFVREEGRHARILAGLVSALGGKLLRRGGSERLFTFARRLLGLRFKILVLLAAEVLGAVVYRALRKRLGNGLFAIALAEIAADEAKHLEFHAAFFRSQPTSRVKRTLFLIVFRMVGVAAVLAVLAENRGDLRALGLSPGGLVHRGFALLGAANRLCAS